MPRRKFRFRRRRTSFRRYFRGNRSSFRKKVKRVIYRMAELKNASGTIATTAGSNLWYYKFCPDIPQGAGDNNRVGNVIFTRNFQMKVTVSMASVQNPVGNPNIITQVRMFIVWPRKLSDLDAVTALTSANFPLTGMIDQDNWIVWRDMSFFMTSNTAINQRTDQVKRVVFNKRFPAKSIFDNSAAVKPEKMPYIIWRTDHAILDNNFNVNGYLKITYKDI